MRDDTPLHLKTGYEYHREMDAIRAELVKEGAQPGSMSLYFAAISLYQERHANDPTYRELQEKWSKNNTIKSDSKKVFLTQEEAAYIAGRLSGTNDPAGHSALQKLIEVFSRPSSPEGR